MPTLCFVRADGCGVCVEKEPVAAAIAREVGLPLETVSLDDPDGMRRAADLRVGTVPALVLVDGERVPFRLVGTMITGPNVRHLLALGGRLHRPA